MEIKLIKDLIDKMATAFEEFKTTNDVRLKAVEANGGTAELDTKLAKIETDLTVFEKAKADLEDAALIQTEKLEQLEADIKARGGNTDDPDPQAKAKGLYKRAFLKAIRAAQTSGFDSQLEAEAKAAFKDISGAAAATGGMTIPEEIFTQIADQVRLKSPMRDLLRVVQVGSPDYKEILNIHGENSGWVGEAGTRTATSTPEFRERAPTKGMLYAFVQATEESLDDMFFNVEQFLVDNISDEFAIAESAAFLTGDGTNKPTGMLDGTPVSTDDDASPPRDADVLEYCPIGTGSPPILSNPDLLLDTVYKLRSSYRQNAVWMLNSLTTATIRKLKQNAEYIWAVGLQPGQPTSLLGYPIRTVEALADVAEDSLSILFGDYARGYLVIDIHGMRVTVDNNLTTPGLVKFYIRKRLGGIIKDNNAIKVGKVSVT